MKWNTTKPPKRKRKPVTIRYSFFEKEGIHQGKFLWSKCEKAFVQCTNDPDGIALYPTDGYAILGWK